jgi:hypothetical protein
MILGDLHEEFVADVRSVGLLSARARYRRRVAGVVAYAFRDLLCLRGGAWASDPSEPEAPGAPVAGRLPYALHGLRQALRALRPPDYRLVAAVVLAAGIGVNTSLFAVAATLPAPLVAVMGGVGLVLLMVCASVASAVLCAGLRRRPGPRSRNPSITPEP